MRQEGKRHRLKVWPAYFEAVACDKKLFEVRKDDRGFEAGDILVLLEWRPGVCDYTGRFIERRVSYKLGGGQFGIEEGYCCLGLAPPISEESQNPADNTASVAIPPCEVCVLCDECSSMHGDEQCLARLWEQLRT